LAAAGHRRVPLVALVRSHGRPRDPVPSGLLAYFSHAMAQPGYDHSAGDALGLALLFIASCAGLIASVLAVPVAWMLRRGWRRRPQRWPASTWDDDEWHGPSP